MRKRTCVILVLAIVLLGAAVGVYCAIGVHYQTHFFEYTSINGIDVSDLTAEQAEQLIAEQAEDYSLAVTTKEGAQEQISGGDIGYRFVSKGEVQEFLEQQNYLAWLPSYIGDAQTWTMTASVTYDRELLRAAASKLSCMQADQVTPPADAYLAQQDGIYVVMPEVEGNQLDADKVNALLTDAVDAGRTSVDFAAEGCYLTPSVRADDGSLKAEAAVRNRYSSLTVTYDMGGGVTETLDSATIASWFSLDGDRQPVFDHDRVAEWVNQLADRYDTIGTYPPFRTSNGETVYVEARTYGWQMDRAAETEALYEQLMSGESAQRSPIWNEGAWTRGENDIGDTYVEIDYTNQRMWYYKNGELLAETPVVTGNVSAGTSSPVGIFCLVGKSEDETLKGEGYSTPVEYWMPFYGGVGIHDADSWRGTYGGDIYRWSGSHGCINTPTAQAAVIYQNIEVGTPIICYEASVNYGYAQVSGGSTVGQGVSGGDGGTGQNIPGGDDGTGQSTSGGEGGTGQSTPGGDGGAGQNASGGDGSTGQGASGGGNQDIIIIDDGSGNGSQSQGVTAEGVPYTGEDLQDVIIID